MSEAFTGNARQMLAITMASSDKIASTAAKATAHIRTKFMSEGSIAVVAGCFSRKGRKY